MNLQKLLDKLRKREGVTERPDPTPVEAPFKFQRPKDLATMVREAVQSAHLAQLAQQEGFDTFEEYDDFDVSDDDENQMTSDHELVYEPDLEREVTKYEKAHLDKSRAEFDKFVKHKQAEAAKAKRVKKKPVEKPADDDDED